MELIVSLTDEDVAILDEFVRSKGLASRSAALHYAVGMLRLPELERNYESAWNEWEASGNHATWDATAADGITDAAR